MDLAVILAGAGEGRRMGALGPKLLVPIGGRPALERVLDSFLEVESVGEIVAVIPVALLDAAEPTLRSRPNPRAVRLSVTPGGATRQDSVRMGIEALIRSLPYVAVHDVARALVTPELIERVLRAARATGAAIPACPVRDSVKEVAMGRVVRSVDRERLEAAQTPQIFARDILARAHAAAEAEHAAATDDAMLVERIGCEIAVVPGEPSNLKLTEPGDLAVLEAWLKARSRAEG
ncbi:MAG TPA: 2-C-methyl-D-erythritol 4-phosphate cytidylyltransferase [Candidatus Eisenbacteria bacterium]